MKYKWLSETFHKTETQSTGETNEYSGKRYWLDFIDVKDFKIDIVVTTRQRNDEQQEVICALRVNEVEVKEQYTATFAEAIDFGESLIDEMKNSIKIIS